jgi:pilus assembly protein CpaB
MMFRILFLLIISVGLLGFGTVAWISIHPQQISGAAPVSDVRVFVAAKALRAGSLLKTDDIALVLIQPGKLAAAAMRDSDVKPGDLAGAMLRRSLQPGDPFLSTDILHPGDHGFLSAVLAPGMRAMTIAVDAVSGTAGLIWPGDHVDVMLIQTADDASQPIGRRVSALTVLGDIRVIAIDQQLVQGATPGEITTKPVATVTLEVTPAQAERVAVASRIGKLSLVVRSSEGQPPQNDDDEARVIWGTDIAPAASMEPPKTDRKTIRIHQGDAEAKEFQF